MVGKGGVQVRGVIIVISVTPGSVVIMMGSSE